MSEPIRKAYKTDLSDEQWSLIQPLLPPPKKTGKKIHVDLREVVNAILYWNRTGVQWDFLPHDFPPKDTVFYHFNAWKKDGTLIRIAKTPHQKSPCRSRARTDAQCRRISEIQHRQPNDQDHRARRRGTDFCVDGKEPTLEQGLRTDQQFERSDGLAGEYFLDAPSSRS